ncbi:hypothetical protein Nepgr_003573 [Nepenthes gracilis]|uniref:Dof-type domain-containing protein n=1 Tax=Nepenthes gracilis TaxID=150966 RepID=A0AAD3RZR4_NEPGR|nr:hypothetical protein Nepgr_003573 [Nepenthes gracilis]
MSEVKDPAIKLFGKTIPLPSNDGAAVVDFEHSYDQKILPSSNSSQEKNKDNKDAPAEGLVSSEQEARSSHTTLEEFKDPATSSAMSDTPRTSFAVEETKNSEKEEQGETSTSQEKPLKKPDKILPCPRCNSMETKFCYFNNYNVNQPRHFCKNCQRYWTAGGTMRNVPVGAGRRKNKTSSASQHRYVMIPEVLQTPRPDAAANGIIRPTLSANGTVLMFGSDVPLCESSVASELNLVDRSPNCISNGFIKPQNGVDHSSGTSKSSSSLIEKGSNGGMQEVTTKNFPGFPPQVPCLPPPWPPYPWNPVQWSSAVSPSLLLPSGFSMSFYPTPPYWGCAVPGSWNVPWLTPPSASPDHSSTSFTATFPSLRKHLRDENMLKPSNSEREAAAGEERSERRVLVPKTLRIDDPDEAAKSSIWATLGIKNEKCDIVNSGGLFRSFQSKGDEKNSTAGKSQALQANPAALSRSLSFQETAL